MCNMTLCQLLGWDLKKLEASLPILECCTTSWGSSSSMWRSSREKQKQNKTESTGSQQPETWKSTRTASSLPYATTQGLSIHYCKNYCKFYHTQENEYNTSIITMYGHHSLRNTTLEMQKEQCALHNTFYSLIPMVTTILKFAFKTICFSLKF